MSAWYLDMIGYEILRMLFFPQNNMAHNNSRLKFKAGPGLACNNSQKDHYQTKI